MDSDLRIEFNRPDRVYGQGETIRGHVIVGGDKGSRCRSVKLRSFWRARGKGTSDTGGTTDVTLHQGALEGMSPYEIPFEIVAPHGPFTYAGKTLQVEHHVSIHVDYSRAVDSEITEAFTLAPGIFVEPPDQALFSRARAQGRKGFGCRRVAGLFLLGAGFVSLPFGLPLMLLGAFVIFPGLWWALSSARLGTVRAHVEGKVGSPATPLPVEVHLKPRKPAEIRAVTAVLRAREITFSGSGSPQRRHEHEVFSERFVISGPASLPAGKETRLRADVRLPDTEAHSFASKHNALLWQLSVEVDVPAWPDWRRDFPLVLWPARARSLEPGRGVGPPAPLPRMGGARAELLSVLEGRRRALAPAAEAPGLPTRPEAPGPTTAGSELGLALRSILAEKPSGGARDPLVRELLGRTFTFHLEVGRIQRSFAVGPDPAYRSGHTILGTLAGTGEEVAVLFPQARDEELKSVRVGGVRTITATVVKWERLRGRPTLKARGGLEPAKPGRSSDARA